MAVPEKDLLLQLDQQLQHAIETSQIEVYGQLSHLYHRGFYSNRTSLWSQSPTLLAHRRRGYLINATPKAALRLAILPTNALVPLIVPLMMLRIVPLAAPRRVPFKAVPVAPRAASGQTPPPDASAFCLDDIGPGLERLCEAMEHYCPSCGLDGFATQALEGGNHYRHILLFRPLDSLALYDIEPL
jgi:hypothetical protein